tara:strand:+ start:5156 stop:6661 length:1506 start_codon:yes stop_codon:yes gene_type:complete
MKKIIIYLFLGFLFSQQEFSFDNMTKTWKNYKFGNQIEFQDKVYEYLANLDPSQRADELKLNFWIIRSLYSDGKIEEAIKYYEDEVKIKLKDVLLHPPYKEEMMNCKNSKCICKNIRKYDPNHNDNLDIISDENLSKHFANVWIVIGRDEKTIHEPDLSPSDFMVEGFTENAIHQPTTPVNVNYGSLDNPQNVRFAILPRPFNQSNFSDCRDDFECQLNNRAKWKRLDTIRNRYWDVENSKIKQISELDELNFTDVLTMEGDPVLKSGKSQYAKLVNLTDGNKTFSSYFPILEDNNSNNNDITSFHRLYVFNERDYYSRYSFKIVYEELDLSTFGSGFDTGLDSGSNDYFVYIKWQNHPDENKRWFLSDFIDKNQFTLAIPNEYSKKYNITINNKSYKTISEDSFNSGMKIISNPDEAELLKYEDWFDDGETVYSEKLDLKNGRVDTDLIEIRPGDFTNKDDVLNIKIEKDIDELEDAKNKKTNRVIWYTVISSFIISALK